MSEAPTQTREMRKLCGYRTLLLRALLTSSEQQLIGQIIKTTTQKNSQWGGPYSNDVQKMQQENRPDTISQMTYNFKQIFAHHV